MSTGDAYILGPDGEPVREPDGDAWRQWARTADITPARDRIDDVVVVTCFLGYDAEATFRVHDPSRKPVLWETTVHALDSSRHTRRQRYTSRAEALAGHARWLERVRAGTWFSEP